MSYKILFLFVFIFLIPMITAERVAVVVDFPDDSIHAECLNANKGENGFELLQDISIDMTWAGPGSFGHQLCKVNNIGDEVSGNACSFAGKYWRFLSGADNKWEYMPVGFDAGTSCWNNDFSSFNGHYCVSDEDLIGVSYGEFSDPRPTYYSFEKICNPLEIDKIKAYVNGGKQSDPDEKGGTIEASPGSKITFSIFLENNYIFDDSLEIEEIEIEFLIEDIDNGNDLKKSIKFKNLDVDEKDDKDISITIPTNLDEEFYDAELTITSEFNGIIQESIIEYEIEIIENSPDTLIQENNEENSEIKTKPIESVDSTLEYEPKIIKLEVKKAIPQQTTESTNIQRTIVPILLGFFLVFLIVSIILIMTILNK